jgi:hypothetical protein
MSKAGAKCFCRVILNCENKNISFYERCGFFETVEVEMKVVLD